MRVNAGEMYIGLADNIIMSEWLKQRSVAGKQSEQQNSHNMWPPDKNATSSSPFCSLNYCHFTVPVILAHVRSTLKTLHTKAYNNIRLLYNPHLHPDRLYLGL